MKNQPGTPGGVPKVFFKITVTVPVTLNTFHIKLLLHTMPGRSENTTLFIRLSLLSTLVLCALTQKLSHSKLHFQIYLV